MKKINMVMMFSAAFLTVVFLFDMARAKADIEPMSNNTAQVLNDEGYGNNDTEYYNSPDDMTNDDEPSDRNNNK